MRAAVVTRKSHARWKIRTRGARKAGTVAPRPVRKKKIFFRTTLQRAAGQGIRLSSRARLAVRRPPTILNTEEPAHAAAAARLRTEPIIWLRRWLPAPVR